jgi:membrane-bound metal-dependent hydrolase YbcI (DUF457 family)
MDPITHTLAAFALSRTGLGNLAPRGELLLVLAVNLPSIDWLSVLLSPAFLLTFVGGPLHSFVASLAFSGLLAAVFWFWLRPGCSPVRFFLLAMAGLLLRLLLDTLPVYGVQLLYPFSGDWFAFGILPYTDPWLLLLLLTYSFWPVICYFVNMEMGIRRRTGQGVAAAAIALAVLYCGYRASNLAEAESIVANHNYGGEVPIRERCFASTFSLVRMHCVLETDSHFVEIDYFTDSYYDAAEARLLNKAPIAKWQVAAYQSSYHRVLEDRLAMPHWMVYPADSPPGATEVVMGDLVLAPEPYPLFRLRLLLDAEERLVDERLRIQVQDMLTLESSRTP